MIRLKFLDIMRRPRIASENTGLVVLFKVAGLNLVAYQWIFLIETYMRYTILVGTLVLVPSRYWIIQTVSFTIKANRLYSH